jgi:hypothetical protein
MGHDHMEMRYNGGVKVAERPVVMCHKAGRYMPRDMCVFCIHYEPAPTMGDKA